MRSPFKFAQHGQSGMWVSDALPHLAQHVDDIALIRSLYTTNITHEPALYLIQTGHMPTGYPTLGSWVTYGLGSENQNLPAYVVLDDPLGLPVNGIENWQAGFLPPLFQGTRFRSTGSPVLNLHSEAGDPPEIVQMQRDLLESARRDAQAAPTRPAEPRRPHRQLRTGGPHASLGDRRARLIAGTGVDAGDVRHRPRADRFVRPALPDRASLGRARRPVRAALHQRPDLGQSHCAGDRPEGGLRPHRSADRWAVARSEAAGLARRNLVVWGGEFGRLPIAQLPPDKDERKAGRDHNKNAFCTWMAGGGVKGGTTYGATDEIGLAAVEDRVSVPDWHATILHLLGLRHEELFIDQNGLKEKLTGVNPARVVREVLA